MKNSTVLAFWGATLIGATWLATAITLTYLSQPKYVLEVARVEPPPVPLEPLQLFMVWAGPLVVIGLLLLIIATIGKAKSK